MWAHHAWAARRAQRHAGGVGRRLVVSWTTGKPVVVSGGAKKGQDRRPTTGSWVVGCGSSLVEHVSVVGAMPTAGESVYFANPNQPVSESVVGGAMMTLLSWAAALRVPTALLGLHGTDASGKAIQAAMHSHGISDVWTVVDPGYATTESTVFATTNGERSTLTMAGCTALIDSAMTRRKFNPALSKAGLAAAEIGLLPLGGVLDWLGEVSDSILCRVFQSKAVGTYLSFAPT